MSNHNPAPSRYWIWCSSRIHKHHNTVRVTALFGLIILIANRNGYVSQCVRNHSACYFSKYKDKARLVAIMYMRYNQYSVIMFSLIGLLFLIACRKEFSKNRMGYMIITWKRSRPVFQTECLSEALTVQVSGVKTLLFVCSVGGWGREGGGILNSQCVCVWRRVQACGRVCHLFRTMCFTSIYFQTTVLNSVACIQH